MDLKLVVSCVLLSIISLHSVQGEPTWTSLRATWAVNVFSSRAFAKVPRREWKARSQGWTHLPGACNEGKFLGSRYIKNGDPALVVMYDVNGHVAGVQNGIPGKDVYNTSVYSYFANSPAHQVSTMDSEDVFFLTVYFVDPEIICENGRTPEEFEEQGTGTGLYIQNGSNPIQDSVHVPMYEEGLNETHWVRGGCYPSMGVHYWYNFSDQMDCLKLFPVTVIYNRGKLTSFAFANPGKFEFSERFEHPGQSTLQRYLPEPLPECILKEYETSEGYSFIHMFFSVRPWNILC